MLAALAWDGGTLTGDLALGLGGLERDATLRSQVLISLFTDRRAAPDDPLPEPGTDRRGWVGDALATIEGDRIGSRLWLLRRAKQTEETRVRAIGYVREALAWLIEDRLAVRVDVDAAWLRTGTLGCRVKITLTEGGVERLDVDLPVGGR